MASILVTGAAGFIGFHVSRRLMERGDTVIGVDNLNNYYDPQLKSDRLALLQSNTRFKFATQDVADRAALDKLVDAQKPKAIVHLAAQAGVRYSLINPHVYAESNLVGFLNILEIARRTSVEHLVYASSSSVYGGNKVLPFSTATAVDHPVSLYAATKKANELMAHSYSHLFGIPATGLRFFTVYGPWGRPDMAMFIFARAILEGRPIQLFNHGHMRRDFTYIDDIVDAVVAVLDKPPTRARRSVPETVESNALHAVYNVGNQHPEDVAHLVALLEHELGRATSREYLPIQPGDVAETAADVADLERDFGVRPRTSLENGVKHFVSWFRYYFAK